MVHGWIKITMITYLVFILSIGIVCGSFIPSLSFRIESEMFSPLILGCASLIVALSSRNASISERVRSNCHALLETQTKLRRENLLAQNSIFWRRYCLNQQALIFVILSLTAFLAASFCSVAIWEMGVRISIIFGSLLLLSGFALTIRDILQSDKTLLLEIEFAESSSCSDDSGRGPGSNPIQG
jgi:hypothetical protein